MENELPKRKPNRLKNFDYSAPGAYFITMCTKNRKCMLSEIVGAIHESPAVKLTEYGKIVDEIINNIPERFNAEIKNYVVMPNHIHLIVHIKNENDLRAIRESPLRNRYVISKLIGFIKMNASKKIHKCYGRTDIWQRSFHDHIIRDVKDYERIYKYICENPIFWKKDCFYTEEILITL